MDILKLAKKYGIDPEPVAPIQIIGSGPTINDAANNGLNWTRTNSDEGFFQATLTNLSSAVDGCVLNLRIVYDDTNGYQKNWGGDVPLKFLPKK